MNIQKILGIVAVLLSIVGAFVAIPQLAALLVVLGLVGGAWIAAEDHVRVIVTALALASLGGVLNNLPAVGGHLASIAANLGLMVAGGALTIIGRNVYRRFKP